MYAYSIHKYSLINILCTECIDDSILYDMLLCCYVIPRD